MLLKNAHIVTEEFQLFTGSLRFGKDGRIQEVGRDLKPEEETFDCGGGYLLPGMVDTHIHGAAGLDCYTMNESNVERFTRFEAAHGVTTLAATLRTEGRDAMLSCMDTMARLSGRQTGGARIRGIHAEGPFLTASRMGATDPEAIAKPDVGYFEELLKTSKGLLKLMTIAAEPEGALKVIDRGTEAGVVMSLGHTDADLATAKDAIEAGAMRTTHTFNAMHPLHHREPGILGAALTDDRVSCEMICDGVHLHPCILKLLHKVKGAELLCAVSDSILACGYPDGYRFMDIDNRPRYVEGGVLHLEDGTIAGSAMSLGEAPKTLRKIGISFPDIARMTSYNPAACLDILSEIGTLTPGKSADLLLLSQEGEIQAVWAQGVLQKKENALY